VAGLLASCSFYTDCPCAHQPAPGPAAAGTGGASGGAGKGTGATGGSGVGGTTSPGGGAGEGGSGNVGPEPGVWVRAIANLAGRSAACGNVNFMARKPDENLLMLNVHQDGFWGSRDGGQSWSRMGASNTSQLISNIPNTVVFDPDHSDTFWEVGIYASSYAFYRTDDDGDTFTGTGNVNHSDLLAINFADPKRRLMLAGGHEQTQTLYRSLDGGETFDQIGDALPTSCQHSSAPVIIDANNWLVGCKTSVVGSIDAGKTWDVRSSFGGEGVPLVTSAGVMYWGIELGGGLIRSEDDGQTWERTVGGGVVAKVPVELPDGSLAGFNSGHVVRSVDEGVTWDPITPDLPWTPSGLVYSEFEGAFFVWQQTCEAKIPKDAVMRYDWVP
jgi:hypothetical protein